MESHEAPVFVPFQSSVSSILQKRWTPFFTSLPHWRAGSRKKQGRTRLARMSYDELHASFQFFPISRLMLPPELHFILYGFYIFDSTCNFDGLFHDDDGTDKACQLHRALDGFDADFFRFQGGFFEYSRLNLGCNGTVVDIFASYLLTVNFLLLDVEKHPRIETSRMA